MANFKQMQVAFESGKVLFKEGDQTKEMYILLAGEVEVSIGGHSVVKISDNGSFLGEMATLLHATRSATVTTTKKSVFLKIHPENIDSLFKVTPELGFKLSKTLAQRLADANAKLAKVGSQEQERDSGHAKISPAEVEASQAELKKQTPVPAAADRSQQLAFLTRTEVHKDMLRYLFNHFAQILPLEQVMSELDFADTISKLVLREFVDLGLARVADEKVEFLFVAEFEPLIEAWIFENGLFRLAS